MSSDSSSSEDESPHPSQSDAKDNSAPTAVDDETMNEADDVPSADESVALPPTKQQPLSPEQAFEEFYLRQATKEFSNDLDKLRSAPDFKESSVPILIEALRQGTACFSADERRKVGQAGVER